jgi:hypothetical protein
MWWPRNRGSQVREAVISFPGHSAYYRVEAVTAARDVVVEKAWRFPDIGTMGEVIAGVTRPVAIDTDHPIWFG